MARVGIIGDLLVPDALVIFEEPLTERGQVRARQESHALRELFNLAREKVPRSP